MRDGLLTALDEGVTVITASRRLARSLGEAHAHAMLARGLKAWPTPAITTWSRWLRDFTELPYAGRQPYCISPVQARVLWDRCISAELADDRTNLGTVVRAAMEAWTLVNAYDVPLEEIATEIDSRDQGVFSRAALRYTRELGRLGWVDEPLLPRTVLGEITDTQDLAGMRLLLAGFDRLTPMQRLLTDRLAQLGAEIDIDAAGKASPVSAAPYESAAAEWRAAGRWARNRLTANPGGRVAIIVTGLERDPTAVGRCVREGYVPGWQASGPHLSRAVNVSLGRALDAYPMIAVALLVLRWVHAPLTSRQLGVLLRCTFLGRASTGARARLEKALRKLAARDWTPARTRRVFAREGCEPDVEDFLDRVGKLDRLLEDGPDSAPPRAWASVFEDVLGIMGWPGAAPLDSLEHQLLNRWRELLGEFASLEPVTGALSLDSAAERLRQLARDAVFQPETTAATLDVLGPLEAAGLSFDAVWVTGLSATAWPGAGGATPLLSRRLQRRYGLPDATPEDTRAFAETVLARISASAPEVVGSYALLDGDSEQGPSLLEPIRVVEREAMDPGWHASRQRDLASLIAVAEDRPPGLQPGERVRGGATTINLQIGEPFGAFARGRLALGSLDPFAEGLTPLLRGDIIHDALKLLYADLPSQGAIRDWTEADLSRRVDAAARNAIRRHRVAAGSTLERLLDFEELRVATLLREVIDVDRERSAFRVLSVEGTSSGVVGGVTLSLRHDRLDTDDDGSIMILDYKTGTRKRFLDKGEPRDYQLVVYAATADGRVSDIGLYNVDRREVGIDGVGTTLSADDDFEEHLAAWIRVVEYAAASLRKGDIRVNIAQPGADARWHALLSRFQELARHV